MKLRHRVLILGLVLLAIQTLTVAAQTSAFTDEPAPKARDLNTPRTFPEIKSKAQWRERAKEIREQILVSCGLWPTPQKTPLRPHIFGKIERDGYSVEKVYFRTYPGFYLAGNLYRPLGKGPGPFPGVLNPHGHWKEGRLADTKDGSVAARCISFARQGMVAFSYDMVGYNDTVFASTATNRTVRELHRQFGTNQTDLLWNISLMGLQTWNSIRALDFLESLPDVDKKRLACTGESGGGTQTYMLGAVDDRLAAQAPVVMVSHTMQGGCLCENAPGLRVEYSNMEIAAVPAPRPQILVAATGDWTKTTLEVEGPAIEGIYQLFGAADRLRYVRFDFGHNYNQTSREAVYEWFGKWLLKHPNPSSLKELPYQKEPDTDLRVFAEGKLPADALTQEQFTESLKELHRRQWQSLVPQTKSDFETFKQMMLPAWNHTLQVAWPQTLFSIISHAGLPEYPGSDPMIICRPGEESGVQATLFDRRNDGRSRSAPTLVVLADLKGASACFDVNGAPTGLAKQLSERGTYLLMLDLSSAGETDDQFAHFYSTYNRTRLQQLVRNLMLACDYAKSGRLYSRVILCGSGRTGLGALLAAPAADAVIADCDQLDVSRDEALLAPDLFCPGIRNIGTFEGAAMLAAPHPLLLHNTGDKFPTDAIRSAYQALGASKKLRIESRRLTDDEIVEWVSRLK